MGRNMFRRVEVAFPVRDPALRKRVVDEGLKAYLADNREAWQLDADGRWSRVKARRGTKKRSAQQELLAKMAAQEDA
jgi:polyphosphate kinase